ncbi:MAG: PilC/PilY family type IV pilus protein [Thermodesulfobacteriota bacterium]|nr:PilC/PilY family type IV pilus protein [Thermodesulfobacteriota bacterium]
MKTINRKQKISPNSGYLCSGGIRKIWLLLLIPALLVCLCAFPAAAEWADDEHSVDNHWDWTEDEILDLPYGPTNGGATDPDVCRFDLTYTAWVEIVVERDGFNQVWAGIHAPATAPNSPGGDGFVAGEILQVESGIEGTPPSPSEGIPAPTNGGDWVYDQTPTADSPTDEIVLTVQLAAGTYYTWVDKVSSDTNYTLEIYFPPGERPDFGDDASNATAITLPYSSTNAECDDPDWVTFTLSSESWVVVNVVETGGGEMYTKLHAPSGSDILDVYEGCHNDYYGGCGFTSGDDEIYDRTYYDDEAFIKAKLAAGTYFVENDQISGDTNYDMHIVITADGEDFGDDYPSDLSNLGDVSAGYVTYLDGELGDSMSSDESAAKGDDDDIDALQFHINAAGTLMIRVEELSPGHGDQFIRLYDDNSGANFDTVDAGLQISDRIQEDTTGDGVAYIQVDITQSGAYYLEVEHDCDSRDHHRSFAMLTIAFDAGMPVCYRDADGDGYGDPNYTTTTATTCADVTGYVSDNSDCDDTDAAIHPGATEICNGEDDDCDGDIDEGLSTIPYYHDADGDGYGDPNDIISSCLGTPPVNYVSNNTDCDDNNPSIHPGAFDICENGIDEDCSGTPPGAPSGDRDCSDVPSICADLADIPLETQVESAPPLLMLLVDDSGSMAWDVLCPEPNGLIQGYSNARCDNAEYWKSQWAGYNGVYYDPAITYNPWPDSTSHTFTDADPDNPLTYPTGFSTTNMDWEFEDIDSALSVKYAHYYTYGTSGQLYLVILNSASVTYYQINPPADNELDPSHIGGSVTPAASEGVLISQYDYDGDGTAADAAEARQNFANWYQYYRTRRHTAIAALSNVVTSVNNINIGLHTLNQNNGVSMVPPRLVDDYEGDILDDLYDVGANSGTPLRRALEDVGQYYQGTYSTLSSPYATSADGGDCQQAFTIMMTDGYYNGYDPSVGNADGGTSDSAYDGEPYADDYSNTLADVAMYYYERDLNTTLSDDVPESALDQARHQHMVTYSVSFGLNGLYDPDAFSCTDSDSTCTGAVAGCTDTTPCTCCPEWPDVDENSENEESITDLWHAALNGRGRYMKANNAQQLAHILSQMLQEVSERRGSGASVAVNTQSLEEDTMMYQGSYNSAGWTGDLEAYEIYSDGSVAEDPTWSAAEMLDAMSDPVASRNIWTMGETGGVEFTYANISSLTADQQAMLGDSATARENLMNYIRGDLTNDTLHGGSLRARATLLGDIVHSSPVHVGNYIYVGGNDGMLHVFNAETGEEVLAYIPSFVYPNLNDLASPDYSHRYFVDLTPFLGLDDYGDALLIGGLGKGGKGYFCLDLDITADLTTDNPANFTGTDVRWEYPAPGDTDDNMGFSFSEPVIVPTENNGNLLIFGNGYDSSNARAVLYAVDPTTGSVITTIDTGVGDAASNCNGLSTPVFVDSDSNGKANYAYAGDLLGNIWKFDLTGDATSTDPDTAWKVAYQDSSSNPMPLFQAKDQSGNPQPVVTRLAVKRHCVNEYSGYMVVFGTGKFNASGDFSSSTTQTIYGIWDWAAEWVSEGETATAQYLGVFNESGPGQLSNMTSGGYFPTEIGENLTLVSQGGSISTQTIDDAEWGSTSSADINWFDINRYLYLASDGHELDYGDNGEGFHVGWFHDFTHLKERNVADPVIHMDYVLITSLVPSDSMCETGGHSYFYAFNACSGEAPDEPLFDINDDGTIYGGDGIDNDGDGEIDEADEELSDGIDNDGDGEIDEADEAIDRINGTDVPNTIRLNDIYYRPTIIYDDETALIFHGSGDPLSPTGSATGGGGEGIKGKNPPIGVLFWRFLTID